MHIPKGLKSLMQDLHCLLIFSSYLQFQDVILILISLNHSHSLSQLFKDDLVRKKMIKIFIFVYSMLIFFSFAYFS